MIKNLNSDTLREISIKREGSTVLDCGAIVVYTGCHTGRSPNAKRIVRDHNTEKTVDWNNNNEISSSEFENYHQKFLSFKNKSGKIGRPPIYCQEVFAVRDERRSVGVEIYTEHAKHALFARNMFVPATEYNFKKSYTLYHFPSLLEEPTVLISISRKIILISGTLYSGEIKKSVFTALNYHFPENNDLPMHCSVNVDENGKNAAIFFGLSGTGKTTLSSDEKRVLIGDDEHGWTSDGLTNFENGCYAKTIRLSKEDEPQIWDACHKQHSILENVVINDFAPDFDDAKYTENTRASYPAKYIDGADKLGYVDEHPENIIMLTCDAFGVLPPVMKLDPDEAVKQFLLGYTAKVAGTESGITEPKVTFSHCFGAPFMPLPGKRYAEILRQKIKYHNVKCWLVNTGWTGGPYGVGNRMPISITRGIIDKIHDGTLEAAETFGHEYTGFSVPDVEESLIPKKLLRPEFGWGDLNDYKASVEKLMHLFEEEAKKY